MSPRRHPNAGIDRRDPAYDEDAGLPFDGPDDEEDEPDNSDMLDPHGEWADYVNDPIKDRSHGFE